MLLMFCMLKNENPAYVSKNNSNREKEATPKIT